MTNDTADQIVRKLRNAQLRNEREQEGLILRKRELERQHKLNAAMIEAYERETNEVRE